MTRCDYDAVFYRVFCITLLAIAFTFTVILTNVFIDIDGLLAHKKDKHNAQMTENIIQDEFTSEATDNDDVNYGENDDSYRTKRSIETQSFLFHVKNPKIKNILTNRLSTLLEELEEEESAVIKEKKTHKDLPKDVELVDPVKLSEDDKKNKAQKEADMLHLTMHNILLQGIIGHMDLNDVYNKVHTLMSNFNELNDRKDGLNSNNEAGKEEFISKPIEDKFFEELFKCDELQRQISETMAAKEEIKIPHTVKAPPPPNVMIKTIIDITSTANEKTKENDTKNSKENVKGIIELVYNGKIIKFTRPDPDKMEIPQKKSLQYSIIKSTPIKNLNSLLESTTAKARMTMNNDYKKIPQSYLNKFVEEYFKRYPLPKDTSTEINDRYETKRLKRHVKVKYEDNFADSREKKNKTDDDELYVEIETHFDSKGLKGEKKKKLIKSLIEKIQNAIHSDLDGKLISTDKHKNKKRKQLHFRKRLQNPLEHKKQVFINQYAIPLRSVVHRQLNPISKTVNIQEKEESVPNIGGRSGEEWKKPCSGPGFLTPSKSINSAEMSQVHVDYSKVLDVNGIPQRLQKPLNTELSEETLNTNSYYDVGKMKFFIKDIDGSGFSVGFNQYVDETPDADTMRLFTGLENVIKTYHQNYDAADPVSTTEANLNTEDKIHDVSSPNNNDHIIVRRSVNKQRDYHSNEYKIIFENNFLPYNNYRDIFKSKESKTNIEHSSKSHNDEMPLIVDENIFEKKLNPAEIFGLANLLDRKKRAMNVKKISNLKRKIKLSRYLNTKAMSTKRIILNKKRNKRQINKIRIIATDLPHMSKHSDENVFVVSDENVFADRAIVKEVETSEFDHDKQDETEYVPYQSDHSIPSTYVTKIFDGRSRHNPLMSKYPHILMEEISRSREEYIPDNALLFGKLPGFSKLIQNVDAEKADEKVATENFSAAPLVPNVTELTKEMRDQEFVNAFMAPPPKTNYKVTVKLVPKNMTNLNSGFKEIHTSINKRFNKNGLLYSSLVNVSEISKVVKLNRSKEGESYIGLKSFLAKKMKDQQEKMQILLKQHAKHINEQLSRLTEEKTNLESILDGDNVTDVNVLDYEDLNESSKPTTSKATRVRKFKKDTTTEADISKEVKTTTSKHKITRAPLKTTILTTTAPPPSPHPHPTSKDKIKNNILTTIERNANLTDQILKKIDKNTEILQMFLKKLTETIPIPAPIALPKPIEVKVEEPKIQEETKIINGFPQMWTNQGMPFSQNIVIRKNDSHISIPFVYAYQQPFMPQKNSNSPVASVVYQTKTLQPKPEALGSAEKLKVTHIIPDMNNQSRFFIDELENDYKVIQVGDVKKNNDYKNMVNGNGTIS